jgi:hypothetical protein
VSATWRPRFEAALSARGVVGAGGFMMDAGVTALLGKSLL